MRIVICDNVIKMDIENAIAREECLLFHHFFCFSTDKLEPSGKDFLVWK